MRGKHLMIWVGALVLVLAAGMVWAQVGNQGMMPPNQMQQQGQYPAQGYGPGYGYGMMGPGGYGPGMMMGRGMMGGGYGYGRGYGMRGPGMMMGGGHGPGMGMMGPGMMGGGMGMMGPGMMGGGMGMMGPGMMGMMMRHMMGGGYGMMGPGMMMGGYGHGMGMMGGGYGMMGGMMNMGRMLPYLNLSPDQWEKVRALAYKRLDKMAGVRSQLLQQRLALLNLLSQPEVDADKVKQIFTKMAELKAELFLASLDYLQQVKKVLTPEQKKLLKGWGLR
ncbi:MAG: periplasmic heavy metal sensor [Deltaproteobacteria bacterium]|nr:periplasmic heavy metal sensor [Deltaproteobacteria bacterium]